MLERAEQERWSVRELRQNVVLHRRAEGERRGRPPISLEVRCLSALRQRVRQVDEAIGEMGKAGALGAEVCSALRGLAVQLGQQRSAWVGSPTAGPDVRPNAAQGRRSIAWRRRIRRHTYSFGERSD